MAKLVNKTGIIKKGDYFEACNLHPCLCFEIDPSRLQIEGISLIDGRVQSCNVLQCGIRILTKDEAIEWKFYGPQNTTKQIEEDIWW